ncbi:hypothetical protein GCM10008983_02160 [Lentibacillus halophilus]|uniref:Transcriptional regulator n=1 Tax=Lentibacillus halophilus TaxID=295065 RepID=A0ABN0Z216_9BACI
MAKVKAGIVGPEDTANVIMNILKEFEESIEPSLFTYTTAEETVEIVEKNQYMVDMWLFSGLTPYSHAKKSSVQQPFFYLELNGTSLTSVLAKMHYHDHHDISRVSIDMIRQRDVYEAYDDLHLSVNDIFFHEYPGYTNLDEVLNFHQQLYNENKVNVCMTCLRYVYEELKKQNIPVYRVTPTKSNIRSTIETSLQRWETMQFKHSQIAVMLVRTGNMDSGQDKHIISYDSHRLNLQLQSAIVDYAEAITGSFVSLGIGEFIVFSTRGSIEQHVSEDYTLLERLALITDHPSHIGIGYGDTALTAEANARLAVYHAQNYDEFCAFLVDHNGTIEGPLQERESITYGYRTDDQEMNEKLENAGVSIMTYKKMLSVQRNSGNHSLTALIVSEWLKMTERNARRILNSLVNHDLAEIIGKETAQAGRPRQIYRIRIDT